MDGYMNRFLGNVRYMKARVDAVTEAVYNSKESMKQRAWAAMLRDDTAPFVPEEQPLENLSSGQNSKDDRANYGIDSIDKELLESRYGILRLRLKDGLLTTAAAATGESMKDMVIDASLYCHQEEVSRARIDPTKIAQTAEQEAINVRDMEVMQGESIFNKTITHTVIKESSSSVTSQDDQQTEHFEAAFVLPSTLNLFKTDLVLKIYDGVSKRFKAGFEESAVVGYCVVPISDLWSDYDLEGAVINPLMKFTDELGFFPDESTRSLDALPEDVDIETLEALYGEGYCEYFSTVLDESRRDSWWTSLCSLTFWQWILLKCLHILRLILWVYPRKVIRRICPVRLRKHCRSCINRIRKDGLLVSRNTQLFPKLIHVIYYALFKRQFQVKEKMLRILPPTLLKEDKFPSKLMAVREKEFSKDARKALFEWTKIDEESDKKLLECYREVTSGKAIVATSPPSGAEDGGTNAAPQPSFWDRFGTTTAAPPKKKHETHELVAMDMMERIGPIPVDDRPRKPSKSPRSPRSGMVSPLSRTGDFPMGDSATDNKSGSAKKYEVATQLGYMVLDITISLRCSPAQIAVLGAVVLNPSSDMLADMIADNTWIADEDREDEDHRWSGEIDFVPNITDSTSMPTYSATLRPSSRPSSPQSGAALANQTAGGRDSRGLLDGRRLISSSRSHSPHQGPSPPATVDTTLGTAPPLIVDTTVGTLPPPTVGTMAGTSTSKERSLKGRQNTSDGQTYRSVDRSGYAPSSKDSLGGIAYDEARSNATESPNQKSNPSGPGTPKQLHRSSSLSSTEEIQGAPPAQCDSGVSLMAKELQGGAATFLKGASETAAQYVTALGEKSEPVIQMFRPSLVSNPEEIAPLVGADEETAPDPEPGMDYATQSSGLSPGGCTVQVIQGGQAGKYDQWSSFGRNAHPSNSELKLQRFVKREGGSRSPYMSMEDFTRRFLSTDSKVSSRNLMGSTRSLGDSSPTSSLDLSSSAAIHLVRPKFSEDVLTSREEKVKKRRNKNLFAGQKTLASEDPIDSTVAGQPGAYGDVSSFTTPGQNLLTPMLAIRQEMFLDEEDDDEDEDEPKVYKDGQLSKNFKSSLASRISNMIGNRAKSVFDSRGKARSPKISGTSPKGFSRFSGNRKCSPANLKTKGAVLGQVVGLSGVKQSERQETDSRANSKKKNVAMRENYVDVKNIATYYKKKFSKDIKHNMKVYNYEESARMISEGCGRISYVWDQIPPLPTTPAANLLVGYLFIVLPMWSFPIIVLCAVLWEGYTRGNDLRSKVYLHEGELLRVKDEEECLKLRDRLRKAQREEKLSGSEQKTRLNNPLTPKDGDDPVANSLELYLESAHMEFQYGAPDPQRTIFDVDVSEITPPRKSFADSVSNATDGSGSKGDSLWEKNSNSALMEQNSALRKSSEDQRVQIAQRKNPHERDESIAARMRDILKVVHAFGVALEDFAGVCERFRFFMYFDEKLISALAICVFATGMCILSLVLYLEMFQYFFKLGWSYVFIKRAYITDEWPILFDYIPDHIEQEHRRMCRKYG